MAKTKELAGGEKTKKVISSQRQDATSVPILGLELPRKGEIEVLSGQQCWFK